MPFHQEHAEDPLQVEADAFTWMAVHGNLQLALRHPANQGPSRAVVQNFVNALGALLVQSHIIDQEDIDKGTALEAREGPRTMRQ
jgi:hypothetical protein